MEVQENKEDNIDEIRNKRNDNAMLDAWAEIPYNREYNEDEEPALLSRLRTAAECLVVDIERSYHYGVLDGTNEIIKVCEILREIAVENIKELDRIRYSQTQKEYK